MSLVWQPITDNPDQLGESPFWHPQESRLYWADVPGRRLHRCGPAGEDLQSWDMPSEPGCMAPAQGGGLVIALRDGVYRAAQWGGALQPLVRFNHDTAVIRFNDGKADPAGRFWAGTIFEPKGQRRAELYSIDCRPGNGSGGKPVVQLKAQNALTANGLAWSPDAGTVYWADTPSHQIQAWDWEAGSNAMRHHRVWRTFAPKPAGWQPGQPGYAGRPDGAAVDAEGNYWCAMFEGSRLLKLSSAGETLEEIAVPVHCPTMPCFGGPDLRTLYLTSAGMARPAAERAERPLSGRVLAARVDVPGLPVNFFID